MTSLIEVPLNILRRMPILVFTMAIVGAFLGGAVVPAIQSGLEAFDQANPVVVMRATLEQSDADQIVIRLAGEKRRDCQYLSMQAYTRMRGSDLLRDAYMQRIDTPETGVTRPIGVYESFGTWRIWPRNEATAVAVYAQHSCGGRLVISRVADLILPRVVNRGA
jgi:hypothetical protein